MFTKLDRPLSTTGYTLAMCLTELPGLHRAVISPDCFDIMPGWGYNGSNQDSGGQEWESNHVIVHSTGFPDAQVEGGDQMHKL